MGWPLTLVWARCSDAAGTRCGVGVCWGDCWVLTVHCRAAALRVELIGALLASCSGLHGRMAVQKTLHRMASGCCRSLLLV
jgi:hypothetical protein